MFGLTQVKSPLLRPGRAGVFGPPSLGPTALNEKDVIPQRKEWWYRKKGKMVLNGKKLKSV